MSEEYKEQARKNKILQVRVGSQLFGTDTPDSDIDYEGVFMPPASAVLGMGSGDRANREVDLGVMAKDDSGRNTKDAIDYKIREYRTFAHLALQNNPNILNILFANEKNIVDINPYGERLMGMAEMFPHLDGLKHYAGYAHAQLHKMTIRPGNYKLLNEAQTILGDCDGKEILVDVARLRGNVFHDGGTGKHIKVGDIYLERGVKASKALAVITGRLDRASNRAGMWEKYGYDVKHASNLIQILEQGIELGTTGRLSFPLGCASLILSIKNGEFALDDIIQMSEDRMLCIRLVQEDGNGIRRKPMRQDVEAFVIKEMRDWVNSEMLC